MHCMGRRVTLDRLIIVQNLTIGSISRLIYWKGSHDSKIWENEGIIDNLIAIPCKMSTISRDYTNKVFGDYNYLQSDGKIWIA